MKNFILDQTSIPGQMAINLKDNNSMSIIDSRVPDIYRTMFASIADCLKIYQDKNLDKIGFIMKDDRGIFKLAAILTYRKPEEGEEEDSGNWYLEFALYPEDVTDLKKEIDNHSDAFVATVTRNADSIAHMRFRETEYIYDVFNAAIDTLIDFLDTNASEEEEIQVVQNGIFTASVAIEDGKKVMSIVPGEIIKQLIKEDSIL